MTNEQRVRTMAGWIGVEISRSRVRTPGKAGYGLYRVRGSLSVMWSLIPGGEIDRSPDQGQPTLWTPYAFTLEMIRICVEDAIRAGTPDGPGPLLLRAYGHGWSDPPDAAVPTRWTQAYRGRRDLGLMGEYGPGMEVPPGGDSLGEQPHEPEGCHAQGRPHLGPCWSTAAVDAALRPDTVRSRQRAANAEFQKAHKRRRDHGLKVRYALKTARKTQPGRTQE